MYLLLGKTSIIYGGGSIGNWGTDEVNLLEERKGCKIPNLPKYINKPSIFQHRKYVLICGGEYNEKGCMKLDGDKWSSSIPLIYERSQPTVIAMKDEVFILGGRSNPTTSEILKHDSDSWIEGPIIPSPGIDRGCGVRISDQEFLLIGGSWS